VIVDSSAASRIFPSPARHPDRSPSTFHRAGADHVIVLDNGYILEIGTPDALIRRGGRFAALLELEAAGWDWHILSPESI
jgi:hypothetical protein